MNWPSGQGRVGTERKRTKNRKKRWHRKRTISRVGARDRPTRALRDLFPRLEREREMEKETTPARTISIIIKQIKFIYFSPTFYYFLAREYRGRTGNEIEIKTASSRILNEITVFYIQEYS